MEYGGHTIPEAVGISDRLGHRLQNIQPLHTLYFDMYPWQAHQIWCFTVGRGLPSSTELPYSPHRKPPPFSAPSSGARIASHVSGCLDKRDAIPKPAYSLPWSTAASKTQALLIHCLWPFAGHP